MKRIKMSGKVPNARKKCVDKLWKPKNQDGNIT